jgi:hypothetical protein
MLAVFGAFRQYAGVTVGESLGYLFTGARTVVVAAAMRSSARFRLWLGWLGLIASVAILVGLLEPAGVAVAGTVNALGYIAWSVWLITAGVSLVRAGSGTAGPQLGRVAA